MTEPKSLLLFHTSWSCYDRNFQVKDLPIEYVSDINYAFYKIENSNGQFIPVSTDPWSDHDKRYISMTKVLDPLDSWESDRGTFGNFGQFVKLKSKHQFRFGLSIGGWSHSKYFSKALETCDSRKHFTQGIVDICVKFPSLIDRIDIDWEFISPSNENYGATDNITHPDDPANFLLFLQLLAQELMVSGLQNIQVTKCITAQVERMKIIPLREISEHVTAINVMTYDFASSEWGPTTSTHQSNLYSTDYAHSSVDTAVQYMLSKGVPACKIMIGVPLYSRGFANTDGLGKPSSGVVADKSWESGVCDYKSLPRVSASEFWDEKAKATYSYDSNKRILNSYDSVRSVTEKCQYVWENGLRGIFVWESSADFPISDKRSIIKALSVGLGINTDSAS